MTQFLTGDRNMTQAFTGFQLWVKAQDGTEITSVHSSRSEAEAEAKIHLNGSVQVTG